jgi:hypothetical protein
MTCSGQQTRPKYDMNSVGRQIQLVTNSPSAKWRVSRFKQDILTHSLTRQFLARPRQLSGPPRTGYQLSAPRQTRRLQALPRLSQARHLSLTPQSIVSPPALCVRYNPREIERKCQIECLRKCQIECHNTCMCQMQCHENARYNAIFSDNVRQVGCQIECQNICSNGM